LRVEPHPVLPNTPHQIGKRPENGPLRVRSPQIKALAVKQRQGRGMKLGTNLLRLIDFATGTAALGVAA
jgi:hypothetical protein